MTVGRSGCIFKCTLHLNILYHYLASFPSVIMMDKHSLESSLVMFLAVVTVGFEPVLYFVNEVDQYVTLYAVLLQGTLEREVSLSFQTSPGTATSTGEAI